MTEAHRADAARNARLYPLYTAAARFHCSAAVFYLFLSEHLTLERLLQLEAIYYVAYVLLEVPSGYFSDRVGRRVTLLVSATATALGFACYAVGSGFAIFAVGQALIAVGWTFRSGTDTTLHYDSLAASGLSREYAQREAIAQRNALAAAAGAALVGGVVGAFWLRGAYVVTAIVSLVPIALVFSMREVPRGVDDSVALPFAQQLALCASFMRRGALAWLFGFYVVMYAIEHVPYMFIQPYLSTLLGDAQGTPLAIGVHTGIAALLASVGAARSVRLRDRLGARTTLLLAMALQTALIGLMAALVHPLIAVLLLARNLAPEVSTVLLNTEITPRIPRGQRATYLSLQGLVGRLLFSGLLLSLSAAAGGSDPKNPAVIGTMLAVCLGFAATGLVALLATRRALAPAKKP